MTSSLLRGGGAASSSLPASRTPRLYPLALGLIAALPLLAGCTYVERARRGSELVVGVAEQYKLETLVQADIERQRVRAARCYSPLLTPATISAAATDGRLGSSWVDGLLRDCPQFGAFLSELMVRRARGAGLVPPSAIAMQLPVMESQARLARPDSAPPGEQFGGQDDGGLTSEAVEQ